MAQPIICDMCGEVAADFMITNVHNGDTMALGAECVGLFAAGIETAAELAETEAGEPATDTVTDPESDEPTDEPVDQATGVTAGDPDQPEPDPAAAEKVEG